MVHGDDVHYGIAEDKNTLLRAVLMFSPIILESRPAALEGLERLTRITTFALNSVETNNVELLLRNIEDEISGKRYGWHEIILCELERFVLIVSRAATAGSAGVKKPNPLVKEVISHLNASYATKQSIEDIANVCCISPSTLRRVFKQETGLGIKEFIIQIRINAAKRLLESSDAKIAAVAYSVGYDSLSAFNREFRLVTGINPSDYRRSSR
jgi:AraC-like DNA-binding protein